MRKTLSLTDFRNEVEEYSENYRYQFSHEGQEALYNYLTDLEENTGEEIEFDWIVFCCDFTEYESEEELRKEYNIKEEKLEDWEGLIARLNNGGILVRKI